MKFNTVNHSKSYQTKSIKLDLKTLSIEPNLLSQIVRIIVPNKIYQTESIEAIPFSLMII